MPFAIKRIDAPQAQRTGFRGWPFVCGRECPESKCAFRSLAERPSTKPWATRLVTSLSDFTSFANVMRRSWPIIDAAEAMSAVPERSRELLVSTGKDASGGVLVAVQDSGPGIRRVVTACSTHSHNQARWHGHGTIDLPIDRRSSSGTNMGL
jgi:hypothetical protein